MHSILHCSSVPRFTIVMTLYHFYRSVVAGAMWFTNEGQQLDIRHTCEHGDHLQKYGWTHHDGMTFGRQEILDDCTYKHHIAKSDLGPMCVCSLSLFFS